MDPTIREQSYAYFLQEAPELLQVLEQGLLSLREDSSITKIHTLMRATHTLKGASASMGLETIKTVAHSLEDIFKALYKPDLVINPEIEALLFEGYECLRAPLMAELTGSNGNDSEVLDRAAGIFTRLQEKLGDCFGQEAYIPTSEELGFDVTQSIFEVGVTQRLEQIAEVIASGQPQAVASTLQAQAEVFLGLAESLNLPGFGAIASAAITALTKHPDDSVTIAAAALADFQQGQAAVLAGDRTQGGSPIALQQLAGGAEGAISGAGGEKSVHIDDAPEFPPAHTHPAPAVEATDSFLDAIWNIPESQATPTDASEALLFAAPDVHIENPEQFPPAHTHPTPAAEATDSLLDAIWNIPESQATPTDASDALLFAGPVLTTSETAYEQLSDQEALYSPTVEDSDFTTLVPTVPATNPQVEEPISRQGDKLLTVETDNSSYQKLAEAPSRIHKKDPVPQFHTVRVNVEHLERLNYLIGELLTNQNRQSLQDEQVQGAIQELLSQLQQHQQLLSQLRDWSDRMLILPEQQRVVTDHHWQPLSQFDPLELDRHSELHVLVQSLLEKAVELEVATDTIDNFSRQSSQIVEKQRRLLSSARDDLFSVRMMPLGDIFSRLPQVLQQLETLYSKPVALKLSGTEVLVDKAVAEKLYDPLLHVVRNAFDHGIEPMEVRRQLNKVEKGQIEIRAFHQGSHLMIEVRDDGQGLKFERIRQRAVDLNLVPQTQAGNLNEAQLMDLLFEPGFSTASQVNNLSGRGIGLDVVRVQLEALQGSVSICSEPHRGTTFLLQIPFSLTMAKLFLCQAGSTDYALLTDAIEHILIPQSDQIREWEGGKVLRWGKGADERLIPVCKLSEFMNYFSPVTEPHSNQPTNPKYNAGVDQLMRVVLLRCQDQLLGLEVDQIIGEQELVIRPLGPMIVPPRYVYGASILADGKLSLVIDGAAVVKYVLEQQRSGSTNRALVSLTPPLLSPTPERHAISAEGSRPRSLAPQLPVQPDSKPRVMPGETLLLVDDSITVRQTLALTLQKSGYQVLQARDGYEAIEQLQLQPAIRLVMCDIEMPRMNGFEFLNYRQQNPALAEIPVVILTSRSGDKHRLMAMELGATAYLNKPYLEQQLLATVAGLIDKNARNFVP